MDDAVKSELANFVAAEMISQLKDEWVIAKRLHDSVAEQAVIRKLHCPFLLDVYDLYSDGPEQAIANIKKDVEAKVASMPVIGINVDALAERVNLAA